MSHVNRMKGRTKKVPSSDQWSRLQTETFIDGNLVQTPCATSLLWAIL